MTTGAQVCHKSHWGLLLEGPCEKVLQHRCSDSPTRLSQMHIFYSTFHTSVTREFVYLKSTRVNLFLPNNLPALLLHSTTHLSLLPTGPYKAFLITSAWPTKIGLSKVKAIHRYFLREKTKLFQEGMHSQQNREEKALERLRQPTSCTQEACTQGAADTDPVITQAQQQPIPPQNLVLQ